MLTRLWSMLRSVSPRELVGTDKAGNLFYRIPSKDGGAERRWVDYKDKASLDPTTLPVEWSSWLHGTRREPPTAQEMIEMEQKRKLVKFKASLIREEEEKRKFRAKSLQSGLTSDDVNPETMELYLQKVTTADADPAQQDTAGGSPKEESKVTQDSSSFPETWQPGTWQPGSPKQQEDR